MIYKGVKSAKEFGIDDEVWAKLDDGLRRKLERLGTSATAEVPVMISLQPAQAPARDETIAQKEARFREESRDVMQVLDRHGVREVQGFWINSTISARVRIAALGELGKRSEVKQILLDVPRKAVP
jgi:hypothetical protein